MEARVHESTGFHATTWEGDGFLDICDTEWKYSNAKQAGRDKDARADAEIQTWG